MPNQASRALVQSLANDDLKLEFKAAQRVQSRLAEVRLKLAKDLAQNPTNWQANRLAPVLDVYLKEFEQQALGDLQVGQQLAKGTNNGRLLVAEAANIPADSNYWNWAPVLPINAISLAEAQASSLIRNVSQQLKTNVLQKVQVGLAMGAPISQIQDDILGVGLRGLKGRDGVFRSASNRAETIARTVSNELINKGAFMTYSQVANKVPELGLMKVWQTLSDNRTSNVCLSLANQIQPLDKPFSGAGWSGELPPAHPNCRSRITALSEPYAKEYESRWSIQPEVGPSQPNKPQAAKKPTPSPPKSVPLPTKAVLSSDPSITQEAVQKAFEQLPERQSEAILSFLKQTEVQLTFTTDGMTKAELKKMAEELKYRARPFSTHRDTLERKLGTKEMFDQNGKPVKAKGYTWVYSNHINVRVANPGSGFEVDQSIIRNNTRAVLNRARNKPNELVPSFSYKYNAGSPEQMFSTAVHELGHQMQYKAGLEGNPPPPGAKWFTKYGDPTVSVNEWHAESFRLWATNPDDYKAADPVGFEYMDQLVSKAVSNPSYAHIPESARYTTKLAGLP